MCTYIIRGHMKKRIICIDIFRDCLSIYDVRTSSIEGRKKVKPKQLGVRFLYQKDT